MQVDIGGVERPSPMRKSGITLNDANVIGLKARSTHYYVWDKACPGFGVQVTPAKTKLMVAKTCVDGRRGWHTLGQYGVSGIEWEDQATGEPRSRKWTVDDYRLKAWALKKAVKDGEDPKAVVLAKKASNVSKREAQVAADLAHSQRLTVNQLADRFIKDHICAKVTMDDTKMVVTKIGAAEDGNRLSTAKEHIRLIEKLIRPAIGSMAMEDVTTKVIDDLLQTIREKTPTQANRVHAVLSKMFVRAERWEDRPTGSNPVKKQVNPAANNKRKRNLTDKEIQDLGRALVSLDPSSQAVEEPTLRGLTTLRLANLSHAAISLALYTGMRKGEIQALRHEWIDYEAQEIHIPAAFHKTGKKTQEERVVLLCNAACALLKSLPRVLGNPFVIAGKGKGALVDLQTPWEKVRTAAGLDYDGTWMQENAKVWKKATEEERKEIKKMIDAKQAHFHDLRRTFSSVATRMGYPELWISALLGHSAGTVTAGYARTNMQDHPLRSAVEALGGRIAGLLDGTIDLSKEGIEARTSSKRVSV